MSRDQASGLHEVAALVAHAAAGLAADRSIGAVAAGIYLRAALDALVSAGATITADEPGHPDTDRIGHGHPDTDHVGHGDPDRVDSGDPTARLVRAEEVVLALPPAVRGQVAVCAAAAYLRRARRAVSLS